MDSNPKHCPSRPSADNLTDDQKEPASLPTSCATSSATPPTGNEAGGSRQPSTTSCGMEEMTTAGVTESPTVRMKGGEDCVASSSSSQSVAERPGTGGAPHRSSDITLALRGSPPCVVKFSPDKHVCSTSVSVPISSQLSGGSGNAGELQVEKDETSGVCNETEASPRGTKRSGKEETALRSVERLRISSKDFLLAVQLAFFTQPCLDR